MCLAHVYSNIRNSNNNKICLHKDTSCPNFSPNSRLAPPFKHFYFHDENNHLIICKLVVNQNTAISKTKKTSLVTGYFVGK